MSKKDEVYEVIMGRLLHAHYVFGQKMLVKELVQETGASRQPVMSALNRLNTDGFVEIIPQVGCQVIAPSNQEIADFFLMFQRMEGLLAELAATRHDPCELALLHAAQDDMITMAKESDPDPVRYAQLNRHFHEAIHTLAHSPMLGKKQHRNFNMSDFFITHSTGFSAFMDDAVREHDQMIEAITKRQPERARLTAEAHIAAIASAVVTGLDAAN